MNTDGLKRRLTRLADYRDKHPVSLEYLSDDELMRLIARHMPDPAAFLSLSADEQYGVIRKICEHGEGAKP